MSLVAIQGAIELGLIYAVMALGIFISFRILNVPDLTVDGSFTLGAAVSAVFAFYGHPYLGLFLSLAAGALAGMVTAFLQTKMKIQPILSGILTMTALYSINLHVMENKSNIALLNKTTIYSQTDELLSGWFPGFSAWITEHIPSGVFQAVITLLILTVLLLLLSRFFATQIGLSIRATGDNEDMVRSSSINTDATKTIGLALSNAVVAFAGALLAQYQNFADAGMGIGMIVIGLASVIIGEVVVGRKGILRNMLAVCVGAVLYRIIIAVALKTNFSASDLKLISALIVMLALSVPVLKEKWEQAKRKKRSARHAETAKDQ